MHRHSPIAIYQYALVGVMLASIGCHPTEDITATSATSAESSTSAESITSVEQQSPAETGADPSDAKATSAIDPTEISATLASFDDLLAKVAEFKGKVVVVDIWSTSCVPCMREFPHLVELAKTHAEDVRCISMNVDYIGLAKKPAEKYVPKVVEFLQKQSAKITNFVSSDPDEFILEKFEVGAMPAILIFAQDGELVTRLTDSNSGEDGLTYAGDVIPAVEKLLSQE